MIWIGLLAVLFGGVLGWYVRDCVAYRPLTRKQRRALDDYWRSWPAMIRDLRRITKR